MDSGFAGGEDEMYNVYDKPWRAGAGLAEKIYRPSKSAIDKDVYGDDVEKLLKSNRWDDVYKNHSQELVSCHKTAVGAHTVSVMKKFPFRFRFTIVVQSLE